MRIKTAEAILKKVRALAALRTAEIENQALQSQHQLALISAAIDRMDQVDDQWFDSFVDLRRAVFLG